MKLIGTQHWHILYVQVYVHGCKRYWIIRMKANQRHTSYSQNMQHSIKKYVFKNISSSLKILQSYPRTSAIHLQKTLSIHMVRFFVAGTSLLQVVSQKSSLRLQSSIERAISILCNKTTHSSLFWCLCQNSQIYGKVKNLGQWSSHKYQLMNG